ncbi:MAG: carboxypeptidase-like regulatory domain-containing protein, partial [Odoribacteraceae bacterium]|nr:carboxypeptidase-like regulatory domain-containing protein [Odoribacteraceae bacterium]
MKLTILLTMMVSLQVSAGGFAQVTLSMKNVPLREVLKEIQRQSGYDFLYTHERVEEVGNVSVDVQNLDLEQAMEECLRNTSLTHVIVDRAVIIQLMTRQSQQQERRLVSGRVTDVTGAPFHGVTVFLKGTTVGALTDANGEFRLGVPVGEKNVLVFSFVGYRTREVEIKGTEPLAIVLEEEIREVDEVVVTGYANIRKSSFTGTATRVTREELQKVSTGNVLQALQVFDPSLRTVRNNEMGSDPNTLPEFNIRGAAGVGITELDRIESSDVSQFALKNNPNLPVFILDGYEVSTEKIYDMDPNRIESITILKDAAATAMYGSRAANGVIVIETIAPRPGELRTTYALTGSFTFPDLSSYDMMNAQEKLDAEVAAGLLDEKSSFYQYFSEYRGKMNNINRGVDTYWLSQPLRTKINHRHSLFLEGGSESVRMGVGLNYDSEAGVMKGSYRDRMGAELRADY